jgi:hypothetical protein
LGREVAANELPVANLGTRRLVPPRTRPSCLKEGKDRMPGWTGSTPSPWLPNRSPPHPVHPVHPVQKQGKTGCAG